jgi:hypothetical protein
VLVRFDPFREIDRSFSLPRPVQDQPHKVPVTAGHAMGNGGGGGKSSQG